MLLVFLLSVITVFAGSKLNDLNIHVVLSNNGDARITETRLMHITSEGTECYIVLQNLNGQTISDLEVSDESGMSFNNIGNGMSIVVVPRKRVSAASSPRAMATRFVGDWAKEENALTSPATRCMA
ncbi:MAG: hypothetical protein II400_08950 [Bacteroidaceae bacterium]|nr:hypothetical protein [Bacteroidaceae bacterium]